MGTHLASPARLASSTSSAADVCIGVDSSLVGQLSPARRCGIARVLELCQRSAGLSELGLVAKCANPPAETAPGWALGLASLELACKKAIEQRLAALKFRAVSELESVTSLCLSVLEIGSIRPYLEAACKWYSEADAGPGAEAGSGYFD